MRGVTSSTNATSEKRLFQPALPMRGVTRPQLLGTVNIVISTRTPHAGSDAALTFLWVVSPFQPALPMRGVTMSTVEGVRAWQFQPALPMRGVTRQRPQGSTGIRFQPALPMRGVTGSRSNGRDHQTISTRTPHAGSDPSNLAIPLSQYDFNPHSPCGE